MKKLPLSFYQRDALQVAPELLGKILVTRVDEEETAGKIVEVEAYTGIEDPASHVFGGKRTPRTEIQYREGGYIYVYLIHGIHYCLNIVVGKEGDPQCVFIRALEPLWGIEIMRKRRGIKGKNLKLLTSGPSRLTQALGIDKSFYGERLDGERIYLLEGEDIGEERILRTPRINVDYAGKASQWLYRFLLKDNPYLSG